MQVRLVVELRLEAKIMDTTVTGVRELKEKLTQRASAITNRDVMLVTATGDSFFSGSCT
jgi:hypothetical protein